MSESYFISDLHLTADTHQLSDALMRLCDRLSSCRDTRLFILGDLFHYWVNTPAQASPGLHTVLERLKALAESGVEIHYFLGNRDFLFRSVPNLPARLRVYPRGTIVQMGQHRYYVSHGDDLCRSDWGYRLMKPWLRASWLERLFNLLGPQWQERIADAMSRSSRKALEEKGGRAPQISLPYCRTLIEQHRLQGIVHGHIHQDSMKRIELAGRSVILLSVGAWDQQGYPVWRFSEKTLRWDRSDMAEPPGERHF